MNDSIKNELLYFDYNTNKAFIMCGTTIGFYIYKLDDGVIIDHGNSIEMLK